MFDSAELLGFLLAVMVLVIVPGPNTMLILAHSAGSGRRAGLATVLGVEVGTLVHTVATALGLSAILSTSAFAFDAVKLVGASYLVFIGVREIVRRDGSDAGAGSSMVSPARAFWRAVLNNILNPKVALFFFALLPQFVRPERGHVFLQFLILGLIVASFGLCFGALLALGAARISASLRNSTFARWLQRATGSILIGLGVRLAFSD